jgi:hypothetical protein
MKSNPDNYTPKIDRYDLWEFTLEAAKNQIDRLFQRRFNFILIIKQNIVQIIQELPARWPENGKNNKSLQHKSDLIPSIRNSMDRLKWDPLLTEDAWYVSPIEEKYFHITNFDPHSSLITQTADLSKDTRWYIADTLDDSYEFPRWLMIDEKKIESIVKNILSGRSGKEFRSGTEFVILINEFMTVKQQQMYRKLSPIKKEKWIDYILDDIIPDIKYNAGIGFHLWEYGWLPEISISRSF